jgi:hypothetical protein
VLRSLSPYFDPSSSSAASFSEACRQLSSVVACAPCHPEIGTGVRAGLCPSLCDEWFAACADGLFVSAEGSLRPCTDASLVCAPLRSIVSSGAQMCARTDLGLGIATRGEARRLKAAAAAASSSTAHSLGDAVKQLLHQHAVPLALTEDGEEPVVDDEDWPACFDGSTSTARVAFSAADAADAAAADEGSAADREPRKRYYKSAEEVAELERQRAARAQARAYDDVAFANHPMALLLDSVGKALERTLLRPLRAEWGRLLRRIPGLPRRWARALQDSPWALAAAIAGLQVLVYSLFLKPLLGKVFDVLRQRRRRREDAELLAVEGASVRVWSSSGPRGPSRFAGPVSASGLSAEEMRRMRADKLEQAAAAAAQAVEEADAAMSASDVDSEADVDAAAALSASSHSTPPAPAREVTIVDGEIVPLTD